jgi:hypothetical protein
MLATGPSLRAAATGKLRSHLGRLRKLDLPLRTVAREKRRRYFMRTPIARHTTILVTSTLEANAI